MFCAFNCFYCKHKNGSIEIRISLVFLSMLKTALLIHTQQQTASERTVDKP